MNICSFPESYWALALTVPLTVSGCKCQGSTRCTTKSSVIGEKWMKYRTISRKRLGLARRATFRARRHSAGADSAAAYFPCWHSDKWNPVKPSPRCDWRRNICCTFPAARPSTGAQLCQSLLPPQRLEKTPSASEVDESIRKITLSSVADRQKWGQTSLKAFLASVSFS